MSTDWVIADDAPFGDDPSEIQADKDARVARWEQVKQQIVPGMLVTGRVFIQAPFGVFFDAGLGFLVLLEVPDFGFPGIKFPDDYPAINSIITGEVTDVARHQIRVKR